MECTDLLLVLKTDGLEDSSVNDNIPVLAIEQTLLASPNETENYFVCSICDQDVNRLPTTPTALVDETTNNVNEPSTVHELTNGHAKDDFCKTAADSLGFPGLQ